MHARLPASPLTRAATASCARDGLCNTRSVYWEPGHKTKRERVHWHKGPQGFNNTGTPRYRTLIFLPSSSRRVENLGINSFQVEEIVVYHLGPYHYAIVIVIKQEIQRSLGRCTNRVHLERAGSPPPPRGR